tara:strand:- start:482 stop:805 length:324 start_codon:yes stop_codon:yes gene_type:complete
MVLKFNREEWYGNPRRNENQRKKKQKKKFASLEKAHRKTVEVILSKQRKISDVYVDVMAGDKLFRSTKKYMRKQATKLENNKFNLKQIEKKMQFYIEQGRIKMEEQK